jgi:hypothetical protein
MAEMANIRAKWFMAGLLALPASAFFTPTWAQGPNYDVQTMNFDLWCQEQQHLDPDRCDKRTPEDEKAFEAYRDKIEQYEIPYLQEKKNQITLDNNILNKDPVDNPINQDPQRQSPQQQRNPTIDTHTPQP